MMILLYYFILLRIAYFLTESKRIFIVGKLLLIVFVLRMFQ